MKDPKTTGECGIKTRISMANVACNKKRALYTSKMNLELRKKLVKYYIWSIALNGGCNLDASAVDQKHLESF
jgi:hypothetical protein